MTLVYNNKIILYLIVFSLGLISSFSLPPYNLFYINFFSYSVLLWILLFNSKEKTLDSIVDSKSLSSGQMQKIAFIRSLLADVQLLLLDESTSNLDVKTRQLIFKILKKKDITIINSTHNYEDFDYDHHLRIIYEDEKRKFLFN